ncbi:hypothetical protein DDE83_006413 [Stemphylium lycopersici]|uniref:Uncharacterized protein n=1 Tax=Stemphylium lycopersici TaxID=183478 RepID=A0A364MZ82_STELY|nr:hypothetical protein DDE83_006413 [Stemphylium lycopersici]
MQMFAPSELLIFISLFSVAAAFPQASIPANTTVTTTYAGEAGPTVTLTLVELKSCLVTYDPVLCSGRDIVELPTATGWYDTKVDSYIVGPPTQTDVVVTSNIPTIVTIETNTAIHNVVPVTSGASNNELEGDDAKPATTTQADRNNSLDTPEQPADSPTGNSVARNPPRSQLIPHPQQPSNPMQPRASPKAPAPQAAAHQMR